MTRTRLIAGAITILCAALAALIIVWVEGRGESHSATALEVANRAYAHESQVTAGLGPNTTIHEVVILHVTPEQAELNHEPVDTRSDGWWGFDGTGNLVAYFARTTDMSGRVLVSTVELMPDGSLVQTNYGGAEVEAHVVVQHYSLAAADVASRFDNAVDANKQQIMQSGQAAAKDENGAYVISTATERVHVDPHTYRVLRVDELASDGSVRESREYTQLDISDGNTVPTAAAVPSTPVEMGSPTVSPSETR